MKKHCYILVSADFKAQNEGTKNDCNTLTTATLLDGRIVVSANALNEFPDLFSDRYRVTTLFLTPNDFPEPQNLIS